MSYPYEQLEKMAQCGTQAIRRPSVMENLQEQRKQLVEQLGYVDAAIQALEENPGAAKVMEALGKVGGGY
jgi:hypothetical protein